MLSHLRRNDNGLGLRLHIGGEATHPDWKTLNVKDADYQQDAADLSNFDAETVDEIYASHILEHFYYGLEGQLKQVLAEWYRVLVPGGLLKVSVPDLEALCKLFLSRQDISERYHLMRIIYGGQTDRYDVHKVGFSFELLCAYLFGAGFESASRVDSFGLFNDCSELVLWNTPISLNVTAKK